MSHEDAAAPCVRRTADTLLEVTLILTMLQIVYVGDGIPPCRHATSRHSHVTARRTFGAAVIVGRILPQYQNNEPLQPQSQDSKAIQEEQNAHNNVKIDKVTPLQ